MTGMLPLASAQIAFLRSVIDVELSDQVDFEGATTIKQALERVEAHVDPSLAQQKSGIPDTGTEGGTNDVRPHCGWNQTDPLIYGLESI